MYIVAPIMSVLCLVLFCYADLYVLSCFAIRLIGEEKDGCYYIFVLQMSCDFKCYVAFACSAIAWSTVCDSLSIFQSYSLTFVIVLYYFND